MTFLAAEAPVSLDLRKAVATELPRFPCGAEPKTDRSAFATAAINAGLEKNARIFSRALLKLYIQQADITMRREYSWN